MRLGLADQRYWIALLCHFYYFNKTLSHNTLTVVGSEYFRYVL